MTSDGALASAALALLVLAAPARCAFADDAESAVRLTLQQWTKDFNAGRVEAVCKLFSPELRYDFRGYPERGYASICARLNSSLRDKSKHYTYGLDIREIIVSGDLVVVRLDWTLSVTLPSGQVVTSVEPGMDVMRKSADGEWKIVRYLAYEAPERPKSRGE